MDNIDSIALLRKETTEAALPVEEAAEESDRSQAHTDHKYGVPEGVCSRFPGPVTNKCRWLGKLKRKETAGFLGRSLPAYNQSCHETIATCGLLPRPHLREQNDLADGLLVCEQHHHPVHADAQASGRGHALHQGNHVIVVYQVRFLIPILLHIHNLPPVQLFGADFGVRIP